MNKKQPRLSSKFDYSEKRRKVYPQGVSGKFRYIKNFFLLVLLALYYGTPWLRWSRPGDAPDQAVMIDLPNRKAYFFELEIWPQEVYYFMGLMIVAALALFMATSLFGRVWCGYTCPHTVFTDIFVKIEAFIQGDRNARMRLDAAPMNAEKVIKKGSTHIAWLLVAFSFALGWVLYFTDAPETIEHLLRFKVSTAVGLWLAGLTASTYLFAGFVREKMCAHMCPYARFQSAMLDDDSIIVTYQAWRGEPRGKHKSGDDWQNRGHCIDCMQCVNVCPTGIDIRDGLQMECISCGLCVDACNNVMDKMQLPRNLIGYESLNNSARLSRGEEVMHNFLRPRTLYYSMVILMICGGMLWGVLTRDTFIFTVIPERGAMYVRLSDGSIRNDYTIRISNKTSATKKYHLTVKGLHHYRLMSGHDKGRELIFTVGAGKVQSHNISIKARTEHKRDIKLVLSDKSGEGESQVYEASFISP